MRIMKLLPILLVSSMSSSAYAGSKFYVEQKSGTDNKYTENTPTLIAIKGDKSGTTYELSSVQKILIDNQTQTDKTGSTCILFSKGAWEESGITQQIADKEDQLYIYPNPVETSLNIYGVKKGDDIIIYNLLGNLVKQVKAGGDQVEINISDLSKGIYIVKIGNKVVKISKK
ncbi:MAG: T9SS type A sorting domain-containing protein [Paludibacteraceae bacterium]|nr:T9SS type A sorting domain-containing protein [Paludibacteraceae bacterium]